MLLFAPLLLSPLIVVAPGRARSSPGRNAAKDGDCEALRLLLESGWRAELDRDRRGASALHMAAGHGHTPALAELLGSMAVDDRTDDGATPLHFAVAGMRSRRGPGQDNGFGTGGHLGTASALLDHGADPAAATATEGNCIVHWAAWAGGVPLLKLLLEGAGGGGGAVVDVHARNAKGCTVAHWAASSGALASCRYLADTHGVDFGARNAEGNTPLTKARGLPRSPRHVLR